MKKTRTFIVIFMIFLSSITFLSFDDNNDFELSKNLDIYYTLIRELNLFYVDEIDFGALVEESINKMLISLDPYTNYIPESRIEDYKFVTTGEYGGIGASVREEKDGIIITELYKDAPAMKYGLKTGDKILEIDGKSTKKNDNYDISKILKGQVGTEVELLIERHTAEKVFTKKILREKIVIDCVPYYNIIRDSLAYIKLTNFMGPAAASVGDAFKKLRDSIKLKGLILDLRGNPGGLLNEAVKIVNFFVEKGQEVVSTKGRIKSWNKKYFTMIEPIDTIIPIIVLINNNSASASEIVAGAMQDLDRAVVMGEKSYGKGLVQNTRELTYNSILKLTIAKYYIPSGRCIQTLDYSHRNADGSVGKVPDSLISEFKTKNGRLVYDGGGIDPDIKIEEIKMEELTMALLNKNIIFDYATEFASKNKKIKDAKDFTITDEDYKNFMDFAKSKNFSYETELDKLLKMTMNKYDEDIKKELSILQKKIEIKKEENFLSFKEQIKKIIENEIVSRFYFQNGRIEASLSFDKDIKKSYEIFNNLESYKNILSGKNKN